jgi:hypothetical protein
MDEEKVIAIDGSTEPWRPPAQPQPYTVIGTLDGDVVVVDHVKALEPMQAMQQAFSSDTAIEVICAVFGWATVVPKKPGGDTA